MDPAAAVKGEMRFSRKKNQPGGGPSGGSPPDREIPRPPHAPLPPIHAGRRAAGAGRFCACGGRGLNGFMMDPAAEGKTRFPRKFPDAQRGSGGEGISLAGNPACAKSSGGRSRRTTRGERVKLPLRVRRGGRLHAPSRRIHDGSNGGSGPGSRSSPFRMQKDGGSPAALSPAGKFPMRAKRVRRACRSMGSGAGGGRPACPAIGWKAREASGCDRPRLRALARMRGTRHARYLQTLPQPYSYADIFLCSYCCCSHMPMQNMLLQILRRPYCYRSHST